jgi:hypothetical protein
MRFIGYHYESPMRDLANRLSAYNHYDHKVKVWNTFVDSGLPGVTDDDFSILPRVLPMTYWPTLSRSVYLITLFTMRLLSLPEREIRAIIPKGPARDYLIDELEILRFRTGRITGSYRYDMAVVESPGRRLPPYLLEINEIGFDGLARSSYFQKVLLDLMPDLRKRLRSLDTVAAEVENMKRLGNQIARFQYDEYNWDELYFWQNARRLGVDFRMISPAQLGADIEEDCPLLEKRRVRTVKDRVAIGDWKPDAVNFSYAHQLSDYREAHQLYRGIVRAKTPQYGSFLTSLVASKTILVLFNDPQLRKKLLGSSKALASSILPAHLLSDVMERGQLKSSREWVLKYSDGCGGKQVFMNRELDLQLRRIPPARRHEWVVQKKAKLNLIDVNGLSSRPKSAICDLGVFVQYDWANGRFLNFKIGGLMSRATNRNLKVNVGCGGLQVAVFLDRGR